MSFTKKGQINVRGENGNRYSGKYEWGKAIIRMRTYKMCIRESSKFIC